jgi:hypothetical protein
MLSDKITYKDYPFDQTPAWQMKLDHEFAYHFGDIAMRHMVGETSLQEFANEILDFRARYSEAWLVTIYAGEDTSFWWETRDEFERGTLPTLQEDLTTETNSD